MKKLKYILTFLSLLGLISIPQILQWLGFEPFVFSSWQEMVKELWDNFGHYLLSLWTTLWVGTIAILISLLIGVPIGIFIGYKEKWLGFFETTMKFIWSIPLIAVAVLLHVLLPSNKELLYIVINGVFLGMFPVLSFAYLKSIEKDDRILNMVASFNLSKFQEFWYFRKNEVWKNLAIPLTQSVPLTFIGITMGEYMIGGGVNSNYFGLGSELKIGLNIEHNFAKVYVVIALMMTLVFTSGIIFEELVKNKNTQS